MRQILAVAFGLCLLGCSPRGEAPATSVATSDPASAATRTVEPAAGTPEPVSLQTGTSGCYLTMFPITGRLVADPAYGASLDGVPIIWPAGFTGRRQAGGGVELLDATGEVVATSGHDYWLGNGMSGGSSAAIAFAACRVIDADDAAGIEGAGPANGAQSATDWYLGEQVTRVLMNIRFKWCDATPSPEWCQWVRRVDGGGPVAANIQDGTLTVGVDAGIPPALAQQLCRDLAADDDVIPGVYTHVDVAADTGTVVTDCFVP